MNAAPWMRWESGSGGGSGPVPPYPRLSALAAFPGGLRRFRASVFRAQVLAWKLSTHTEVVSTHRRPVHCLALEAVDSMYLLCGGLDGCVSLYDLEHHATTSGHGSNVPPRRRIHALSTASAGSKGTSVSSVRWYPTDHGAFASTDFEGGLTIWDTNCFAPVGRFDLRSMIYNCQFNTDGSLIALALEDKSIRLCDPLSGCTTHVLDGHQGGVTAVEWQPSDEHVLASASFDGRVKMWDVRKGSYDAALISFDRHQDHTATAGYWIRDDNDDSNGRGGAGGAAGAGRQGGAARPPPTASSSSSSSSAGGRGMGRGMGMGRGTLAAAAAGAMRRDRLDAQDLNRMTRFDWTRDQVARAHDAAVIAIKYTPCGRYLVSSGNDNRVRLWSAHDGTLHNINYDITCQSKLPVGIDIAAFTGGSGDDLLLHPDGNGEVAVVPLHTSSGRPLQRLKGHLGAVTAVVYRQRYNQVVSAAKDGMVFVWDSSVADALAEARGGSDGGTRGAAQRAASGGNGWGSGAVAGSFNHNDDAWSDDEPDANADADGDGDDGDGGAGAAPARPFLPPILRQYIDDADDSARRFLAAKAAKAAASGGGGGGGPRRAAAAGGGHGSAAAGDVGSGASKWRRGAPTAREAEEAAFSSAAVAAIRGTTSSSSSSSSSSAAAAAAAGAAAAAEEAKAPLKVKVNHREMLRKKFLKNRPRPRR